MELTARRALLVLALCVSASARSQTPSAFPVTAPRPAASGKDLRGRWGFGISNIGPGQTPTLSADWHVTQASGFEFNLGVDTGADANLLSLAARFHRNLFIEDHLLYSLYLGGGLISQQSTTVAGAVATSSSGYLLEVGTAAKFFLTGLPNLGLSIGGGLRLESMGGVRFRSAVNGGMHYYF